MSDIFISYARKDRGTAQRLAKTLEAQGWSAWWDTRLRAGEVWDKVIERELAAARCVIVLWSETSVQRNWVREEAREGLRRGILVPIRIENVEPPLPFKGIQAGDLIDWKGHRGHPGFKQLMADVAGIIGPPPSPPPPTDGLQPEPAPPTPDNSAWSRWLAQSVEAIKRYAAAIADRWPRKRHLAVAGGIALLVVGGVVYSLYEPPQPPPGPEESLPQTFETNTHGITAEVTDFFMAGES